MDGEGGFSDPCEKFGKLKIFNEFLKLNKILPDIFKLK